MVFIKELSILVYHYLGGRSDICFDFDCASNNLAFVDKKGRAVLGNIGARGLFCSKNVFQIVKRGKLHL